MEHGRINANNKKLNRFFFAPLFSVYATELFCFGLPYNFLTVFFVCGSSLQFNSDSLLSHRFTGLLDLVQSVKEVAR